MQHARYFAILIILFLMTGCSEQQSPPLSQPSLVAIHATWCDACQRDKPLLIEIAKTFSVTEIDFDRQHSIALQYNVRTLPTYIILTNNIEIGRTDNIHSALNMLNQLRQ